MKNFYAIALLSSVFMVSGCAVFFDKNVATDENKIVAGEGLPSAAHEFDEEAKVAVAEEKVSASEAKEEPKEKVQPEKKESEKKVVAKADKPQAKADDVKPEPKEEQAAPEPEEEKPLVDKIAEETPEETSKMPDIKYLSDEEFIASMERVGSAKTTPVETEELSVVTEEEVATAEALPEKAFVPSVTYQLDTFYFENGSSFLDADYRERIRKIVRAAKKDNAHVRVVGHASSRTNDTDIVSHKLANFMVSQKRAEAVAEELRRAGMPAELISVEALSDSAPAYLEVMPEGERLNRRVEVFLSY